MNNFVRGSCREMCPASEVKMRTKEHLLHFFELLDGAPYKPVKCFSRSAAGMKTPKEVDLRTPLALEKTVTYLLTDILMDERKPFFYVYDFIFDRLRSVRQEIVIQNMDKEKSIKLLEPTILFLAYSRYRLNAEPIQNFDSKICDQHLQECMKKVLGYYDELDVEKNNEPPAIETRNRILVEALYQLFNLGQTEALSRTLILKSNIRKNPTFNLAMRASLEYFRQNYFSCLQKVINFEHILCAIASLKLANIRREILLRFSHAYNSKCLTVPIFFIQNVLYYDSSEELIQDLHYYNIEISSDKSSIKFLKSNFNINKDVIQSKKERFVEKKLKKINLPEVICNIKMTKI
ncbi:SAC3 domain-containing protein 1 isoform X2 [Condylostylus longicornis]|uniref:SAC3 domain-containing protein 1 isoform X2 n=1 Tax=Condylostylus longicornis TaxID=2530218 RepID=UPI00244DA595|nr:SAC3 domain-containing protein 1 isoform X2 [Condylostylus longicornis]